MALPLPAAAPDDREISAGGLVALREDILAMISLITVDRSDSD